MALTAPTASTRAPASLVADAIAVFTLSMKIAGSAISMAVLVFSGALEVGLSRGIGSFVAAGGIMAIWIAARSAIVPAATIVQDGPAIVMAAVAAGLVARSDAVQVGDVFVLLALTTLVTGIAMWAIGHFRLGALVRYMPTTVVGAFIAGTGWLLFKGGFAVMIGSDIGVGDVVGLFDLDMTKFWVPGLLLGLVGWLLGRSDRAPAYSVGLAVILSLGAFWVVVAVASSVEAVEQGGWLIGPFPDTAGFTMVSLSEVQNADWAGIGASIPGIASVVGLAIVAQLLNLTGLGSQLAPRLDVDGEVRTSATANIVASLLGTSPGFHALGDTLLAHRMGATRRLVAILTGVILLGLGVLGVGAIGYVPRLIIGALLVIVGVGLLEEWIQSLLRTTSWVEQALSAAILLVIAWFGILEGIGAGLVAACAVFVVRYSRVDPVRAVGSGSDLRSRVDRSPSEEETLKAAQDQFAAFELQGYLFFGSLTMLEDQIRKATADAAVNKRLDGTDAGGSAGLDGADAAASDGLDAVILDFKNVTGIDSSGYEVIGRLLEELDTSGIAVWASSLSEKAAAALAATVPDLPSGVRFAVTLDEAVEQCEQLQLQAVFGGSGENNERAAKEVAVSDSVLAEFDEVEYAPGAVVMHYGAPSDGMLIVKSGHLTALQVFEDGTRRRLRRFGAMTIVGEIGVIKSTTRTAEILAETTVAGWWLSAERYHELRRSEPEIILELHEFIMKIQAERVITLSQGLARTLR